MTATDELRRLLDERGVEYGSGFGGDTLWTGRHGIEWRWDKQDGTLAMFTHAITPEQAVEATLGRGTCRFIDEDNYNEAEGYDAYSWFRCSACGWTFDECDRWLTTMSYCPNCGRKVVDA